MSDPSAPLFEVHLLNLPIAIQQEASSHRDALVREFALIQASSSTSSLPRRLLELVDELQDRFDRFSIAPRAALQQASAAGSDTIDLVYEVPGEVGHAVVQLGRLLDEADDYCRAGQHLVTLAASPLVVAFRQWFIDEFQRQLSGEPPTAWELPDLAEQERWPAAIEGESAVVQLSGDLDLASAPALRDQLSELHTRGVRSFELDSSDVSFVDSVGLSVILALYRRCHDEGGAVVITAPSRVMRRTLEVSGLLEVLDVRV